MSPASFAYAGFEDAYFLSILRPEGGVAESQDHARSNLVATTKNRTRCWRSRCSPRAVILRGELLGAPKEYDLLQSIGDGVEKSLNFGIFGPISVFFLKALRWIYGHVGNYGVAIILLTLGIRILLFPLMHTSTVSMRKMAKVQPKVKEIQAKYKKKKTDPQARAKMNQEMMALYKQEGVNPMAGCLPLLVQMPLLWALYQLFLKAIELRHEPFIWWITDLSAKDPLYVTPILMTATMWLQQRLAPQAGDPQQQQLMRMMPLIFGIMFLQFPAGLVLYWLANNVITIIQQEITLHIVGERKIGGRKRSQGRTRRNDGAEELSRRDTRRGVEFGVRRACGADGGDSIRRGRVGVGRAGGDRGGDRSGGRARSFHVGNQPRRWARYHGPARGRTRPSRANWRRRRGAADRIRRARSRRSAVPVQPRPQPAAGRPPAGPPRLATDSKPAAPHKLQEQAEAAADEALRSGTPVTLGPLTPAARREIHLALADDPGVETESDGDGFLKRIVIRPRRRR